MLRLLLIYPLLLQIPVIAHADAVPIVAEVSGTDGALPDGWEPIRFSKVPDPTEYGLVTVEGAQAIRAQSRSSASGLVRKIRVDLEEHPRLRFRWRTEGVIEAQDLRSKDGDDSPVRIYVLFEPEPERLSLARRLAYQAVRLFYGEVPTRSIVYVWSTGPMEPDLFPNPYTDLVTTIVAESGRDRVGEWVEVERDVRIDYRRAFGEDPPAVRAVAVMSDTDNTGESVVAYYGSIAFLPSPD